MTQATLDHLIDSALRRDRVVLVVSLLAMTALAWAYLWLEADAMDRLMAGAMPVMLPTAATAGTLALTFLMWAVMMLGMMLPSATPVVLFYAAIVRKNGERGTVLPAAWIFAAGYVLIWTAFSLAATGMQVAFEALSLATPMMVVTGSWLAGGLLLAAGLYQWSPLKAICLVKCRSPLAFITGHWRAGRLGALRMGAAHGLYCLGCCWALMLLLFVGGVMNLLWVAAVTAFVLIEKLMPCGLVAGRVAGVGMVAAGLHLLLFA